MHDALVNFIKEYLSTISTIDQRHLSKDTRLLDGSIDSLCLIKLISALQQKFNVSIDNSDVVDANFHNIDRLGLYLSEKINQQSTSI